MTTVVFDRLVSGGEPYFDRLADVTGGIPFISDITGAQDGEALTITGTAFSASGNSVWVGQPDDDSPVELTIDTEGTTEIVVDPLSADSLWLTRTTPIFVRNSSDVASNVVSVAVAPKATEVAYAITQEFLGDAATRIESAPPLILGDEIRVRNVVGSTLNDYHQTGQGAFDLDDGATSFEARAFDGSVVGDWATQTLEDLVITTAVPDVVDQPLAVATVLIQAAGLLADTVAEVPDATIDAGNVIAQFPAAGSLQPLGATVELTVSLGIVTGIVPNVVGLSQIDAQFALSAAGFASTANAIIDGHNTGLVIDQSVLPGTVLSIGAVIIIAVSSNLMPSLIGISFSAAVARISEANLTLNSSFAREASLIYPLDYVIQQSPPPGDPVLPLDVVTLTLSLSDVATPDNQLIGVRPRTTLHEFLLGQ